MSQPEFTEEELRQLEAEMERISVDDVLIQTTVTLLNLAARKAGLGAPPESGPAPTADWEQVRQAIEGARRATKIFGIVRFTGYFREAAGPGWVLLGDSGHFKDPAAGRGIGDAFLQIRRLEPVIASGPGESGIDERLAAWWRWRDREFAEHYWVGADFGAAGTLPAAAPEMIRRLHARGRTDRLVELLSHRRRPSQVLTVPAFAAATVRLLRDGDRDRRALLGETRTLVAREARRRRMVRRPVYAPPEVTLADAAPTDTDHPEARAGSHVPAAR